MACSFQPINPDQGSQSESLPEFIPPPNMTDEERKRWKKKNRKRQKQLRRKQREANNKVSSESSCEVNLADDAADDDDGLLDDDSPSTEPNSQVKGSVKLGHRKSHSIGGISLDAQRQPVSDPVNDWLQGGLISRSIGPEFHFFSDTELEIKSPDGSRPSSPFLSDTEFEVGNGRSKNQNLESSGHCPRQSWRWGELPSPPVVPLGRNTSPPKSASRPVSRDGSPSKTSPDGVVPRTSDSSATRTEIARPAQTPEEKEAQRSMVSQVFSFMRQTKKMRNQATAAGGGMYLDDFNAESLDPELASLYLTQSSFRQAGLHHHDPSAPSYASRYILFSLKIPFRRVNNRARNWHSLP